MTYETTPFLVLECPCRPTKQPLSTKPGRTLRWSVCGLCGEPKQIVYIVADQTQSNAAARRTA